MTPDEESALSLEESFGRVADKLISQEENRHHKSRRAKFRLETGQPRPYTIEYNGVRDTVKGWASRLGVKLPTLRARLFHRGWSVERAFTAAIQEHKHS